MNAKLFIPFGFGVGKKTKNEKKNPFIYFALYGAFAFKNITALESTVLCISKLMVYHNPFHFKFMFMFKTSSESPSVHCEHSS